MFIDLYKRGAEIIAKAKGISVEDMPHNGLDALMNLPPVTPKRKKGSGLIRKVVAVAAQNAVDMRLTKLMAILFI